VIDNAREWIRLRSSDDSDDNHRAATETVPLAVWMQIHSKAPDLRAFIAYNRTSPPEMLAILARDENRLVRHAVAERHDAPVSALRELADDVDERVRVLVAGHPSTQRDVLQYLSRVDAADAVRVKASARLRAQAHPSSHS
jgi:hypothetical protein